MSLQLGFKRLDKNAKIPTQAHEGDKCYDLYTIEEVEFPKYEGGNYFGVPVVTVRTGLVFSLPDGFGIVIKDKSGIASKLGLHVMAGEIDNGYTGEIQVVMANFSGQHVKLEKGQKFAQFKLEKIYDAEFVEIENLTITERKDGGFGSTGKY